MSEEVIVVVDEDSTELIRHQVGKLVFGTLAGFIAGKLTEKVYDWALTAYRQRTGS